MIYKRRKRKAIPEGAKLSKRNGKTWAKWSGGSGEVAPDGRHVWVESRYWTTKIRDADGRRREVATGCRDKGAALARVAEWQREHERVKAGVLSASDAACSKWGDVPLTQHVADFGDWLRERGRTSAHIKTTLRYVERAVAGMRWNRLRDLNRDQAERWLSDCEVGARTWNAFAVALVSFGNFLLRVRRLTTSPFTKFHKQNEAQDRRRIRRALTPAEAGRLLEAAAARPLHDAMHKNRGAEPAVLTEATRDRLLWRGRVRATCYMLMLRTGLRWSEARSLTLGNIHLGGDTPHVELTAQHEKSRKGSRLPLDRRTAALLDDYMAARRRRLTRGGKVIPLADLNGSRLFDVPKAAPAQAFKRDLAHAGILRVDERGRVVDIHCLRHSFITHLAQAGVPLATLQKLARHSTPALTQNVYVHLGLDDLGAAVGALPVLDGDLRAEAEAMGAEKSGGGDGHAVSPENEREKVRPKVRPPDGINRQKLATFDTIRNGVNNSGEGAQVAGNEGVKHGRGERIRTSALSTPSHGGAGLNPLQTLTKTSGAGDGATKSATRAADLLAVLKALSRAERAEILADLLGDD